MPKAGACPPAPRSLPQMVVGQRRNEQIVNEALMRNCILLREAWKLHGRKKRGADSVYFHNCLLMPVNNNVHQTEGLNFNEKWWFSLKGCWKNGKHEFRLGENDEKSCILTEAKLMNFKFWTPLGRNAQSRFERKMSLVQGKRYIFQEKSTAPRREWGQKGEGERPLKMILGFKYYIEPVFRV